MYMVACLEEVGGQLLVHARRDAVQKLHHRHLGPQPTYIHT